AWGWSPTRSPRAPCPLRASPKPTHGPDRRRPAGATCPACRAPAASSSRSLSSWRAKFARVGPGLKQRIESFDWLRGVALLFMIQCHSVMFLLDPSLKGSPLYRTLLKLDGLVAPSFIFAAGFSLALVQVRSASKGSRSQRVRKTLRRLGEVLAVATLVNWMWFPVFREPKWLLRIDILHCIGLSLLIALPLLLGLATRPKVLRWVTLALAIAVFAITPLFAKTTGWPSLFLNSSSGALFPLLPWAGYV